MNPLTMADCPLLPDQQALVEQFNDVLKNVNDLRDEVRNQSQYLERIETDVINLLNQAFIKLKRTHYRVGFLGTTAAGKSTTVNNLLKVSKDDAPAKSGGGPATTAAPSRIRKSTDGKNHISLRYMNQADYEKRRTDLASHLGFGPGLTEEELIDKCIELEYLHSQGSLVRQKLDDLIALRLLIQSRQKYAQFILQSKDRHLEKGEYNNRGDYLNHPFDPKNPDAPMVVSSNRLLWQGEIDLSNDVLPSTLEMVDLPGLGAGKHHDTCVTMDVIKNEGADGLDGALVFLNAGRLSNEEVQNLVIELLDNWKKKANDRVWLIITQYDSLTEAHLGQDGIWFDAVAGVLAKMEIKPHCCFIVSNEVKMPEGLSDDDRIRRAAPMLKNREFHELTTQSNFQRHPSLEPLIKEIYLNGGIERLRKALITRLANDIANEVAGDVRALVANAKSNLDRLRAFIERQKKQNPEDRNKATACAKQVDKVIWQCRRGLPELKAATNDLVTGLNKTMHEKSSVSNIKQITPSAIPGEFKHLADMLDSEFPTLLEAGCMPLFKRISAELSTLPAVAVQNADSVSDAWEKAKQAAEEQLLSPNVTRFRDLSLIDRLLNRANKMKADEFTELLEEKIRSVTIETIHQMKMRLLDDLSKIHGDLKLLMSSN